MTADQFIAAIHRLGFPSPYAAGKSGKIGVSKSQAQKYASGETEVPEPIRLLLEAYLRHGLPE
jgi:hypothetical protein